MPYQSYPIGGIVYDNNRVAIEGVTVYLINASTQEILPTANYATTNVNGEYILNLQNLSGGYSNGDTIEVIAEKASSRYDTYRTTTTVNTTAGAETDLDLFMDFDMTKFRNGSVREMLSKGNYKGFISGHKRSFMVWANNKTGTSTATIVKTGGGGWGKGYTTSAVPVINLNSGEVAYIEQLTVQVRTASKVCAFDIAKCTSADGGGTATAVSGAIYAANGTIAGIKPYTIKFANPIKIEYNSSSAQSIGVRTTATDTSTYVDFIMEGYVLEE